LPARRAACAGVGFRRQTPAARRRPPASPADVACRRRYVWSAPRGCQDGGARQPADLPGGRSRALKSWGKSRENLQHNNFFRKYDFSLDKHDHISYMARTDT